jgi:hypothetical protein
MGRDFSRFFMLKGTTDEIFGAFCPVRLAVFDLFPGSYYGRRPK